jgi:hypothetical protein
MAEASSFTPFGYGTASLKVIASSSLEIALLMTPQIPKIKLEVMEEADDTTTYCPVIDENVNLKVCIQVML